MQALLDKEEKEAKEILNLKITVEQELEDKKIEADQEAKLRNENREN
jgi:hypothetical protein